jgi:hypothetical protein
MTAGDRRLPSAKLSEAAVVAPEFIERRNCEQDIRIDKENR